MFSLTSKSRKSIAILSAGAAALLITGLGVSNATADNLTWDPSGSSAGPSNGGGTWNGSTSNWYDTTSSTGPVGWTNGDGAYFGAGSGGSGTYTVTLGSSGTYSTATLGVNNSGNAYVLDGSSGTVTGTGQVVVNGGLTLQNITLSGYKNIEVNTGGVVGSVLNINTGTTISMPATNTNLFLSDVPNGGTSGTTGTVDINGGSPTVGAITVAANGTNQTGILNINSGTVTTTAIAGVTSKSAANVGSPTIVNLNGGTLNTYWITSTNKGDVVVNFNGGTLQAHNNGGIGAASSGYTMPTGSLNVQAGGAVTDSNAHTYWIQSPLLHDAALGSTPDGGLTIKDSPSAGTTQQPSTVTLQGVNTYTGPTTVQGGGNLTLGGAATSANGVALAAATIADSSSVTIASNGVLTLANDVTSANVAPTAATQVQALNMSGGGSISFFLSDTQSPTLSIGSKANVSGVNTINIFGFPSTAPSPTTSFTYGTYTLISDSLGGLSGGTFAFGNGNQTDTTSVGGNSYLLTLGSTDNLETLTVSAVPEPATLGLFAIGGMALVLLGRKRKAQI